jgi:hypothetical protein
LATGRPHGGQPVDPADCDPGCSQRLRNPDFNVSQLGVVTRWTPVKNLTFSAEVMWFHLDQKFTGAATLTPVAPKPTAFYEYKDQDTVSFNVRAQRNF